MIDFTERDVAQLEKKGISKDKVARQIETFKEGIPFVNLKKAAVVDVGIIKVKEEEQKELISYFEDNIEELKLLKFVPASGAATRMFKFLFEFLKDYDPEKESINSYINKHELKDLSIFLFISNFHLKKPESTHKKREKNNGVCETDFCF